MKRGNPARLSLCLLALIGAAPFGIPKLAGQTAPEARARIELNFDPDWKFIKADPSGAAAPEFDDAAWSTVSAPHTYNDVDTFDHWSNRGMTGERIQWSGRTWYRKKFTLPTAWRGKKVYLEFEGVRQVGEVYLNGRFLGAGKSGFVPFGF